MPSTSITILLNSTRTKDYGTLIRNIIIIIIAKTDDNKIFFLDNRFVEFNMQV